MISLRFRPEFEDDWSEGQFTGDAESLASNILASRLLANSFDVEILADDEWIPIEEFCDDE